MKSLSGDRLQNAGTIEFLMDEDGSLHFIEMNTRIQVEHPVTEMTTDVDLVKSQILIAAGEKLSDVITRAGVFRGHAIECRINAEHPESFTPSAGKITAFNLPGGTGIRVDTAAYAEGVIPPYYDSLIAKLCARGRDRDEAISRMARALDMFVVEGIYTSIPLHQRIMARCGLPRGNFDTKFMERFLARATAKRPLRCRQLCRSPPGLPSCTPSSMSPALRRRCARRAAIVEFARDLAAGGVTLLQYRNKEGTHARDAEPCARNQARARRRGDAHHERSRRHLRGRRIRRCSLGQDDLSPEGARAGGRARAHRRRLDAQSGAVERSRCGPGGLHCLLGRCFATTAKKNPDAVVGLEGVRAARAATKKPLVAIGGITRANATFGDRGGRRLGGGHCGPAELAAKVAEEFLRLLV